MLYGTYLCVYVCHGVCMRVKHKLYDTSFSSVNCTTCVLRRTLGASGIDGIMRDSWMVDVTFFEPVITKNSPACCISGVLIP